MSADETHPIETNVLSRDGRRDRQDERPCLYDTGSYGLMTAGRSIPCPVFGTPLDAALPPHVRARLTQFEDGSYGLGAVTTYPSALGHHLLREHGNGQRLDLDEEGIMVACRGPKCDYMSILTADGFEAEDTDEPD